MKSQGIWCVVSITVVIIGAGFQLSSAQDQPSDPFAAPPERPVATSASPYRSVVVRAADDLWDPNSGPDSKTLIRKAAEALRDAKSDETRDQAEDKLRELLSKYFHEDMKRREADLQQMESRLKKLQEQLARRHDKKDEIVDLQIKVLINEADGLGFFSSPSPPMGLPSATSPYYFYSPRTAEEATAIIQPTPILPGATSTAPPLEPTPGSEEPVGAPAPVGARQR